MNHPFKALTTGEWLLWVGSLILVTISHLAAGRADGLTLAATWIGITSLLFAAKGNVWAQILMVLFSILYGIISFRFRYWGEMMTYLGMSMPMAIWSTVTWMRNPSSEKEGTVAIRRLDGRYAAVLLAASLMVTGGFYFVLLALDTPNLAFSTVSVATSFLAAALTMLRSSYYALGYAANDLVLIVLWGLASGKDASYLPLVVNFAIFFLHDMYGFYSWRKREQRQAAV